MTNQNVILSARGLYMHYHEDEPVLEDVSIDLIPGKLLSIVGPSGSGKTTLLKLLAGLINPTKGSLIFDGKRMEGPDIRLVPGYEEIKLVEQHSGLRPNISAEENLNVALLAFKDSYRKERLEYLLELFSLTEFRKFYPRELSGGQQQRLTIACAMANEPAILLMDEPFSALDPANTALLLKNIQKLANQTKTAIVLVTHDTRYALTADEVMIIFNGKVVQKDTPEFLYSHPKSEQVARFFGPISKISHGLARQLGIPSHSKSAIRAEFVKVKKSGKGVAGIISNQLFMGMYDLLEIKLENGDRILSSDFGKRWKKGQSVVIEIPLKRLFNI